MMSETKLPPQDRITLNTMRIMRLNKAVDLDIMDRLDEIRRAQAAIRKAEKELQRDAS
jgi:queuine/archaeosine tRNA-ribosyltransferase